MLYPGSFVAVYGLLDGDPYAASFAVDGSAPAAESMSQVPSSPKPDWPFFSRLLNPGPHELEVTVNSGTFNLDYIDITSPDDSNGTGDTSQGSAHPSAGPSQAAASATALPFSKTRLSKGAVAGISVAGAVLVLLLVLMIYFVLFRRTRRVRHRSVSPEKPLELIPEGTSRVPSVCLLRPLLTSHRLTGQPKPPPRRHVRLGSIYRPTPARSAQSSKTTTSSAPTSITQSSAMFTSVIMLSPALSMVSEESDRLPEV